MDGPNHYQEAERLLATHSTAPANELVARAQVHAQLALAAAVIYTTPWLSGSDRGSMRLEAWFEVLG